MPESTRHRPDSDDFPPVPCSTSRSSTPSAAIAGSPEGARPGSSASQKTLPGYVADDGHVRLAGLVCSLVVAVILQLERVVSS